jgi:hypothetical protein
MSWEQLDNVLDILFGIQKVLWQTLLFMELSFPEAQVWNDDVL